MAIKSRTALKGVFETGDKPTGSDYADLIDSFLHLTDSTAQSVTSDASMQVVTATEVSAAVANIGNILVSGSSVFKDALSIAGALAASASAHFNGPVRVGTGATQGYAYLYQFVTVAHNNSAGNPVNITVPSGSDILEFYVDTTNNFAAGALTTAASIEIGVSGSNKYFCVIPVSASNKERLLGSTLAHRTANISRWKNFTGGPANTAVIQAFVTAQQATAMTVGEAYLTVTYAQK